LSGRASSSPVDDTCSHCYADYKCSHAEGGSRRQAVAQAFRPAGNVREAESMAGTIGDQELALLRHVAEHGGTTVGEAAEAFGEPRGLARSTVLTMMERLRKKGHLTRRLAQGVYRYTSRAPANEVMRDVVRDFVRQTLEGSVAPFVAYLSEDAQVSDAELAELEELVERLQQRKTEGTS